MKILILSLLFLFSYAEAFFLDIPDVNSQLTGLELAEYEVEIRLQWGFAY